MKTFLALAATVLTLAGATIGSSHIEVNAPPPTRLGRVAVLVLENRSWGQIVGNPHAPYLNSLMRRAAVATHYYAITHPSLPNYVALTTGGHKHVNHDCSTCRASGRSLANQLEAAKISWRAYFESIATPLSTTWGHGSAYDPHYNPFAYTRGLRAPDPIGDVTNFASLRRDLRHRTLPRFSWIAPNVWHDGHNVKLRVVDRFAKGLVPSIVRALGPRGVLFITWDEGRDADTQGAHGRGGGHVPLIAIGPGANTGARVAVRANHYALLRTIESSLGLHALGHARDHNTPSLNGLLA